MCLFCGALSWPMEGTVVVFQPLHFISDLHVVDIVSTSLEWIQSVERSTSETPQDICFNDQHSSHLLLMS